MKRGSPLNFANVDDDDDVCGAAAVDDNDVATAAADVDDGDGDLGSPSALLRSEVCCEIIGFVGISSSCIFSLVTMANFLRTKSNVVGERAFVSRFKSPVTVVLLSLAFEEDLTSSMRLFNVKERQFLELSFSIPLELSVIC